jgi:hypothetical protein
MNIRKIITKQASLYITEVDVKMVSTLFTYLNNSGVNSLRYTLQLRQV